MACSSTQPTKTSIILESSDELRFPVEVNVVLQMGMMRNYFIQDNLDSIPNNVFPVPNVTGVILKKVINYCKKHVKSPLKSNLFIEDYEENLKNWDIKFMNKANQNTLFHLILAAHSMQIKSLTDLTCQTVADFIKGKSTDEIRNMLNIKNDFGWPKDDDDDKMLNIKLWFSKMCQSLITWPWAYCCSSSHKMKMMFLVSSDGKVLRVEERVALQSKIINDVIINNSNNDQVDVNRIILPGVNGVILSKVVEYCQKHHTSDDDYEEDLKNWDEEFVTRLGDLNTLFDLIKAATYLEIKSLMYFSCRTLAHIILHQGD
ncbi:unnamed protein product [Amaranthus hypochondriacus]